MALAAVTLFIVACGDDATNTPAATGQPTATATSAPAPTNTPTQASSVPVESRLKISVPVPDYQHLALWDHSSSSGGFLVPIYEHLVTVNKTTGTNEPWVAESWDLTPDGKNWNFKLRQGIKFHSTPTFTGGDLTAKDFVQTVKMLANPDQALFPAIWGGFGAADSNFEIKNDYEFTWKLDKVEATLAEWVNRNQIAGIQSKAYFDQVGFDGYAAHPVGSGAFQFVEYNQGVSILHKRVENHWRKTSEFPELQVFFVPENSTRLAMLLNNEVHISDVPRNLLPEAEGRGYRVATGTLPGFTYVIFINGQYYDGPRPILAGVNAGKTEPLAPGYDPNDPLRKVEVRKALNIAINRDLIIDTFWGSSAVPQAMFSLIPTHPNHRQEWTVYPYDPDGARQALTDAGYPNGIDLDFWVAALSGIPEAPEIGEAIAQMWAEVGIRTKITQTEFGTIRDKYRARDGARFVYAARYSISAFQNNTCFPMSNVAGGCGSPQWEYDELDQIFLDLKGAVLPEDIAKYTHEFGDFMYNNYLFVPGAYIYPQVAYNPNVVAEYLPDLSNAGPLKDHEYTKAVMR
jgi:ABC-type transport system substrate-binding protein